MWQPARSFVAGAEACSAQTLFLPEPADVITVAARRGGRTGPQHLFVSSAANWLLRRKPTGGEAATDRVVTRRPGVEEAEASQRMSFRSTKAKAAAATGGFAASIGRRLSPQRLA